MSRNILISGVLGLAGLCWFAPGHAKLLDYPYQSCFEIASKLHDVPLDVLLAVAATESNWNPDARSHANAHGIMQIQWPGTAKHLGVKRVSELYNPCLNIDLGARYLSELLILNDGDLDRSLAAYNYGPSRIARSSNLPEGAQRYVATVSRHRARITSKATISPENLTRRATSGVMRFDSATRARRYSAALNEQIDSAEFLWQATSDGAYRVTMTVAPPGLSLGDANRLHVLGWLTGD